MLATVLAISNGAAVHESRQLPSWLIFDVGQKMKVLRAPLAIVERDDGEFVFFRAVEDMLNDRFDILWGDAYDGWDATGQYFSLVRREPPRRWWHVLVSTDRSSLVIECVRPGFRVAEAEARIRRLLNASVPDFAGLLEIGATHDLFGAVKR